MTLAVSAHALDISRYVAEGGDGDGLTKETPSGNLLEALRASKYADHTTIYLAPGTYDLPLQMYADNEVFNNISLYGGGGTGAVEDLPEKSIITGDLYINGGVVMNIDFRGGEKEYGDIPGTHHGKLDGAFNMFYTNASRVELGLYGSEYYILGCNVKCLYAGGKGAAWASGATVLHMDDCNFIDGTGAYVGGRCEITNCRFENNSEIGLSIAPAMGSTVRDCKFKGNKGKGAIVVENQFDDNMVLVIDRCIISGNKTSEQTCSPGITANATPVLVRNCMIALNRYDLNIENNLYYGNPMSYLGAVSIGRRQSQVVNCTFLRNSTAAIYYGLQGEQNSFPQFLNCVFLENDKPFESRFGLEPVIGYSAADFGAAIPELDAERHMTRINMESAKMKMNYDRVIILEGSPLINKGIPNISYDYNDNSHLMLGGTDLGCAEYTGTWSLKQDSAPLTVGTTEYKRVYTEYDGVKYYALVRAGAISEEGEPDLADAIYLGDCIAAPKVLDEWNVVAYMTIDGQKAAVLYTRTLTDPWSKTGKWISSESMVYEPLQPTQAKTGNTWHLKKQTAAPKPQAPKKKTPATGTKRRR